MPEQVNPMLRAPGARAIKDINTDMFVLLQCISRGQQERRAKQIPLQFQPRIRRHIEQFAHDGVYGTDQNGDQDHPHDGSSDGFGDTVDQARQRQRSLHCCSSQNPRVFTRFCIWHNW